MSKTVDDLAWVYLEAFAEEGGHDITAVSKPDPRTIAGVKAIVRALRDEVDAIWTDEDMGCGTILDVFNQILDSDAGNEKVAGGSTREDGQGAGQLGAASSRTATTPATAPAPAVCEWTRISEFDMVVHYSTPHGVMNDLHLWRGLQCSACHAPIKFTEAK